LSWRGTTTRSGSGRRVRRHDEGTKKTSAFASSEVRASSASPSSRGKLVYVVYDCQKGKQSSCPREATLVSPPQFHSSFLRTTFVLPEYCRAKYSTNGNDGFTCFFPTFSYLSHLSSSHASCADTPHRPGPLPTRTSRRSSDPSHLCSPHYSHPCWPPAYRTRPQTRGVAGREGASVGGRGGWCAQLSFPPLCDTDVDPYSLA
jgi:hypothetical protein